VRGKRLLSVLCACLSILHAVIAVSAHQESGHVVQFRDGEAASESEARLVNDAQLAMRRLDHWLRPYPLEALTIDTLPWYSPMIGDVSDARIVVPDKLLAATRDRAAARVLVVGLTQLYWPATANADVFSIGVRTYIATRVFHDQFSGNHYYTVNCSAGLPPTRCGQSC
jgi:hypothetical protein